MQKAWRKNQQTLTIIHQCLDDATFEIVVNATTTKHVWEVLEESKQGVDNMRKVCLEKLCGDFFRIFYKSIGHIQSNEEI